ncbi:MAG: LysR family transcriptional regulator [Proteobacteria bacterium]|nr:LysR family transcriptional regulator [Pseudomonadota bacterium]MBU1742120.1 LysR family transcriptional regulator [Pseudomonadota bacterium]
MKIKSKFWIEDDQGEVIFGQGRVDMLRAIDQSGSINQAAKMLKMSFRGMWARIKATEERLGLRLVLTDGRDEGGKRGSRLTDEARQLIAVFEELEARGRAHADRSFAKLFKPVQTAINLDQ